jgi:hypothetical protein
VASGATPAPTLSPRLSRLAGCGSEAQVCLYFGSYTKTTFHGGSVRCSFPVCVPCFLSGLVVFMPAIIGRARTQVNGHSGVKYVKYLEFDPEIHQSRTATSDRTRSSRRWDWCERRGRTKPGVLRSCDRGWRSRDREPVRAFRGEGHPLLRRRRTGGEPLRRTSG